MRISVRASNPISPTPTTSQPSCPSVFRISGRWSPIDVRMSLARYHTTPPEAAGSFRPIRISYSNAATSVVSGGGMDASIEDEKAGCGATPRRSARQELPELDTVDHHLRNRDPVAPRVHADVR